MKNHFSELFQLLSPSDFSAFRHLAGDDNIWRRFDQVICPVDSVKPVERRRGWTRERLERHNQERIGDLTAAGWDLIIVDESHRLVAAPILSPGISWVKLWLKPLPTYCCCRPHLTKARRNLSIG